MLILVFVGVPSAWGLWNRHGIRDAPPAPGTGKSTALGQFAFAHAFGIACAGHSPWSLGPMARHGSSSSTGLTKVNHPWTNGQVERMNRTIKEATVKRYHYRTHEQFRIHLSDFVAAYNFARRLKTLRGLTPYEYEVLPLKSDTELPRFHRRLIGWSQATISRPTLSSRKVLSASAGGICPIGPRRRRLSNRATRFSVSHSTAPAVFKGPRRWMTAASSSPTMVSARASS